MRDAEVTDAVTQKNCATTQMKSRNSAHCWLIDCAQMNGTIGRSSLALSTTLCVSGIAKVTASSRIQPKTTETNTDVHMPVAAMREASFVSSAVCADASKPVIVYWDIRRPRPNTNQNAGLENDVVPPP